MNVNIVTMDGLSFMSKMTYIYDRQFQERQLKILRKQLLRRDSNNVYATILCERMKSAFGLRTLPPIDQVLPLIHFTEDDSHETSTHFTLIYTSSSLNPLQSICDHFFGSSIIQLQREVYQLISANNLNVSEDDEEDEAMVNVDDDFVNDDANNEVDDDVDDDTLSDSEVRDSVTESEGDDEEMVNEINRNIRKLEFRHHRPNEEQSRGITVSRDDESPETSGHPVMTNGNHSSCEAEEGKVVDLMKKKCLPNGVSGSSTSLSTPVSTPLTNTSIVPLLSELTDQVPHTLFQLYMDRTLNNSMHNKMESSRFDSTVSDNGACGQAKRGPGRPRKHPNSLEKKYVCDRCLKSFNVRSHLESHMVTHTGEKKYTCNHCGNKFTQSSSLRNHVIALHTRNFPHVCNICRKGFLLPSQLKKHKGLVHPDKLRPSHRPLSQ